MNNNTESSNIHFGFQMDFNDTKKNGLFQNKTISLKRGLKETSQHTLRKASTVEIIWLLSTWP